MSFRLEKHFSFTSVNGRQVGKTACASLSIILISFGFIEKRTRLSLKSIQSEAYTIMYKTCVNNQNNDFDGSRDC